MNARTQQRGKNLPSLNQAAANAKIPQDKPANPVPEGLVTLESLKGLLTGSSRMIWYASQLNKADKLSERQPSFFVDYCTKNHEKKYFGTADVIVIAKMKRPSTYHCTIRVVRNGDAVTYTSEVQENLVGKELEHIKETDWCAKLDATPRAKKAEAKVEVKAEEKPAETQGEEKPTTPAEGGETQTDAGQAEGGDQA